MNYENKKNKKEATYINGSGSEISDDILQDSF